MYLCKRVVKMKALKKVNASPKIITIKSNSDFQQIFEKGHSINGRYLVVYFLHNQQKLSRFGFCVGRKLGIAVARNRVKRRLREVVRQVGRYRHSILQPENNGFDIIIVARKPVLTAQYQDIIRDFEHIMLKTGIIGNEQRQDPL